jgi:hypothetical protein
MPYNRHFTQQDVARILDASEGRVVPGATGPQAPIGHVFAQHTNLRTNFFGRKNSGGKPIKQDTTFLVPPARMAELVHEALNSVPGQSQLVALNHPDCKRVEIESILIRRHEDFDIFINYQPKGKQLSFDWLSTTTGDGFIFQLFVLVYKMPNSAREDIHIQTAYANDFARLQGDEIVRVRPPGTA